MPPLYATAIWAVRSQRSYLRSGRSGRAETDV